MRNPYTGIGELLASDEIIIRPVLLLLTGEVRPQSLISDVRRLIAARLIVNQVKLPGL